MSLCGELKENRFLKPEKELRRIIISGTCYYFTNKHLQQHLRYSQLDKQKASVYISRKKTLVH